MVSAPKPTQRNQLHELGYKIFLDRYAQKDMNRTTLAVGDTVIVVVDSKTGQREIGTVNAIDLPQVTIALNDGEIVTRDLEHVDKPLETDPAQMQARVAQGIAQAEATPELREQWARKFEWLLDDFKFVPAGRILAAAGTDQQLTFYNCMPPEQEVLTEGGYKPLGEVRVGDLVVTHRNRLRPVLHKFERETEEAIYTIKPKKLGFDDLRVTGDHKILTIRAEWINKHRSRDGLRLSQEPQWLPARELRAGDFLAVAHNGEECPPDPIYLTDYLPETYSEQAGKVSKPTTRGAHGYVQDWGTHFSLNNTLELDADLLYLFGRWLGDGCVTHRTKSDIPSGIKIVFALDELAEAEQIARIIEDKFGIAASIKLSSTERWYDLWVNSMPMGQFFKAFLGAYSYGKRIPEPLMHLSRELTISLLRGLFSADGYTSDTQLGIVLSNRVMATQVHHLLLRLGYFFSIKENTHRLGKVPAYRISANASECGDLFGAFFDRTAPDDDGGFKTYLEYNDLRWVRIDTIETSDYRGMVMDIEVAEDHSFVSAGVVVSNCYVVPSPKDSRNGIIETLRQMTEIMSRGGGVGINISSLRPRHAYVKGVNGRSSGAVSWGALYSFVTGLIEQGGSRRGALMLILDDWHPDVFDFINSKREAGKITNANISVGVSDRLMELIKTDGDWPLIFPDSHHPQYDEEWDGNIEAWQAKGYPVITHRTVKARDVWDAIIESAWASAEPGVFFRERYNKMSNSWYHSPIIATNPCFSGDTRLYTSEGLVKMRDLFDDETEIEVAIDGRFGLTNATAPSTRVFMTGTKPVFRLQTKEGYSVRATADHRFMTPRGWVEMRHLQPGDKIHILNRKGGFGKQGSLELGRILGWLIGDGTFNGKEAVLSFFGDEKRELTSLFAEYVNDAVAPLGVHQTRAYPVGATAVKGRDEARVSSARLMKLAAEYGLTEDKFRVPEAVFRGTEAMQRGFLQALFTADGGVQQTVAKGVTIRLASSHMTLLEETQMLLANFGIVSRIYANRRPAGQRMMPDGKGGSKAYAIRAQHELVIGKTNLLTFADEIGFMTDAKNQKLAERLTSYRTGAPYREHFVASVAAITPDGIEEVFDVTEPITHSISVNGVIAHQCGEQGLPGFGVCNLGAINLAKFYDEDKHDVKWGDLDQAVRYATRFLDNVIDSTPYFFDENAKQQLGERRVGLNNMGLAELMIRLGIRYGSDESVAFIDKLYAFIARASYETSAELAAEKGAFPLFDADKFLQSGFMQSMPDDIRDTVRRKGIRNVTLLTQAPTGTTGTMVNTSTGIEPFFSWVYYRKSRLGLHEEQVPLVKDWYEAHPDATELPDHFVTAMDLAPEEHVKVQAAIQRWVDSSISKTSNLPNHYTVDQTRKLYEYMYELGCKGGTVYRDGSRDEQVLMLKGDERAESEMSGLKKEAVPLVDAVQQDVGPTATPHRVWPRPKRLTGVTVSTKTGFGTAYITMNSDENGYPFEVFITAPGKAGSDLQADAEGLGRMISLQLRTTAPVNRMQMLKLIIDQLKDIGGARTYGMGPNRVLSLPDAVAGALMEQYFRSDEAQQLSLFNGGHAVHEEEISPTHIPVEDAHAASNGHMPAMAGADICPSCGTVSLIRAEGCRKCLTCGYSEC